MITHYDLFAGIGGFSIALEEVFSDEAIEHIFCEWDGFCTAVLKKHWPEAEYWGDITELVADTERQGRQGKGSEAERQYGLPDRTRSHEEQGISRAAADPNSGASRPRVSTKPVQEERLERSTNSTGSRNELTIVTGGFPCQPFSHAGRRKGTADDRYQWPNMFEVIRNVKPTWVIAENVRGLVTWNEGMVLEQVCSDLESEGYEVQPFIIPAVAVGAPHRRDRVWIVARCAKNADSGRWNTQSRSRTIGTEKRNDDNAIASNTNGAERSYPDWSRSWQEVAFATCNDGVDDGLPRIVDGVPISRAKWRKESLKAYGNAIAPQVAMEIFKAIKEAEYSSQPN